MAVAALRDQRAQLGGRLRHLDLEVGDVLDLARHAGQQRHRQAAFRSTGASWIMIGIETASETMRKKS